MGPSVILAVLAGFVLASAPAAAPASSTEAAAVRYFDEQIAPLLGRSCVECHGPTKRKGRLDLSQRDAAFAGGGGGKVILPGNAKESLLWQLVESDEMPEYIETVRSAVEIDAAADARRILPPDLRAGHDGPQVGRKCRQASGNFHAG